MHLSAAKYFIFYGPVLFSASPAGPFPPCARIQPFPLYIDRNAAVLFCQTDTEKLPPRSRPAPRTVPSTSLISNAVFFSAKMAGSVMPITISSASVMQLKRFLSRHRFLSADVRTGNPTYRLTAALRKRRLLHGLLVRLYRLIRPFCINGVLFKKSIPLFLFPFR